MSTRTLFCLMMAIVIVSAMRTGAQNLQADSIVYSNGASSAISRFKSAMGDRLEIYNGPAYDLLPAGSKGTFYFQDKNYCTPAAVRYAGTWYTDVPVMYDVRNDLMISLLNSNFYALRTDKLADLFFADHHFINLTTANQLNLPTGFYDMLYGGELQLLAKRTKIVRDENMGTQGVGYVYEDHTDLYLKKGNKYIEVNSKSAFLDALSDKRKLLNQYLKDNRISYNNDKEAVAAKLTAYYDSLNK